MNSFGLATALIGGAAGKASKVSQVAGLTGDMSQAARLANVTGDLSQASRVGRVAGAMENLGGFGGLLQRGRQAAGGVFDNIVGLPKHLQDNLVLGHNLILGLLEWG